MAKLSLSWAINRRKRIRIVTGLAVLALLFFGISMMVSNNPKGTKAAPINVFHKDATVMYQIDTTAKTIWIDAADIAPPGTFYFLLQDNWICPMDPSGATTVCDATFADDGSGRFSPVNTRRYQIPPDYDVTYGGNNKIGAMYTLGTNHFKSLTMGANATISHFALTTTEASTCDANANFSILDAGDTSSGPCTYARSKKVEIILDGNLTLASNAKIDVTGKGYPGGFFALDGGTSGRAYGPGSGGNAVAIDHSSGTGGSFGGFGKRTLAAGQVTGVGTIYNYLNGSGDLEWGSGGGAVYWAGGGDYSGSVGGNGGGRVKIQCATLTINPGSYISADGGTGNPNGGQIDIAAGGGSGGAIWINANAINTSLVKSTDSNVFPTKFTASVDGGRNTNLASVNFGNDGVIKTVDAVGELFQISAKGGDSLKGDRTMATGNGGGGGWIVIDRNPLQPITIKKTLLPVQRYFEVGDVICDIATPGTNRNCFNPYALQKLDRIRVNLEVTNYIAGSITMTDEMLHVPYNAAIYCHYEVGTVYANGVQVNPATVSSPSAPNFEVSWPYTIAAGTPTLTFTYTCQME